MKGQRRFDRVDPLHASYPWYSPYQFAGNNPIWAVDLDGLEEKKVIDQSKPLSETMLSKSDVDKINQMVQDRTLLINNLISKLDLPDAYKQAGTAQNTAAYQALDNAMINDFSLEKDREMGMDAIGLANDLKITNKLKEEAGIATAKGMKIFGFSAGKRLTGFLIASGSVGVMIEITDKLLFGETAGEGSTPGENYQKQTMNAALKYFNEQAEDIETNNKQKDMLDTSPIPAAQDNTSTSKTQEKDN